MRRLTRVVAFSLLAILMTLVWAAVAQGQQSVTVSMEDNYFEQADITVPVGTTVTWVQNGNNPHTTTSYDGLWDSGLIAGGSGGTFSFTFDEPGTYAYYCMPHEAQGMVGTVTVTGGGAQQAAGAGAQQLAPTGGPPLVVLPVALFLLVSGALIAVLRRVP